MLKTLVCQKYHVPLMCSVALGVIVVSQNASAQSISGDNATADGDSKIIVVTATRREEALQDVPISLSVLQSEELAARGISRVKDIEAFIPNVSLSDAGNSNSNTNIVIRGISTDARNVGFESGVSVYVDGVFTGRPISFNQDLVGIERVEVLRGPQGTLFGKNTIAGAINITTTKPDYDFGGMVAAEYGRFDKLAGQFALNVPLVVDKAAIRISGFGRSRDGIVRNVIDNERFNDEGAWGGRIQLRLEPSDGWMIDLSGDYMDESRRQSFPETLNDPAAPGPRTTINDLIPIETRIVGGAGLTVGYETSSGHNITSITAYRENKGRSANDNDNTADDVLVADFADEQKLFTQELRLVSPSDQQFTYALGLFYFWQESDANHQGIFGADFPLTGGNRVSIGSLGSVTTNSYAAYADVQFRISDVFSLLGGARVTHEKKGLSYTQTGGLLPGVIFEPIPTITDSISDTDFSPQFGIKVEPSDNFTGYVKVSWGFKSGGWNADFIGSSVIAAAVADPSGNGVFDATDIDFSSERAINYEVGVRGQTSDRKLSAGLTGFFTDYSNLQVSQFLGVLNGGTVITNAGSADITGVEFDVTAKPSPRWKFNAAVGYLNAEFKEYVNCTPAVASCAGNDLPFAPRWSVNLGGEYTMPLNDSLDFIARANVSTRSEVFTTAENIGRLSIPSYTLVNLSAEILSNDMGWSLTGYIDNLFDTDYLVGAVNDDLLGTGRTFVGFGLPQTYGVRARFQF